MNNQVGLFSKHKFRASCEFYATISSFKVIFLLTLVSVIVTKTLDSATTTTDVYKPENKTLKGSLVPLHQGCNQTWSLFWASQYSTEQGTQVVSMKSGWLGHPGSQWVNIARSHSRCRDYKASKSRLLLSRMSCTHLRHNKWKMESHTPPCLLTQLMGHLTPPVPWPKTKGSVYPSGFSLLGWQQHVVWSS